MEVWLCETLTVQSRTSAWRQHGFRPLIQHHPYFNVSKRTTYCDQKPATYPLSFLIAANNRIGMGLFPKVASLFHSVVLFYQQDSSLQELVILSHSTKLSILFLPSKLTKLKLHTDRLRDTTVSLACLPLDLCVCQLREATQPLNYEKDNLLEAPTGSKKRRGQRDSMDIKMNCKNST